MAENQNFKSWLEAEVLPRVQRENDEVFSLLRYANEETDGHDTTLGAAMIRLVQGYGQGGGDSMAARLDGTLTSYSNSTSTMIPESAFYKCSSLTDIKMTACTRISLTAMYGTSIRSVDDTNFPALQYVGQRAFRECKQLKYFRKPTTAMSVGGVAFEGCSELEYFDVLSGTWVEGNQALLFYNCAKLKAVIIRRTDAVNAYPWVNGFNGSGIASGIGFIYVPRSLVASYQAHSDWSKYSSQIRAIEDYPDIANGTYQ